MRPTSCAARAKVEARKTAEACSSGRRQPAQQPERVLDRLASDGIAIAIELNEMTLGLQAVFDPVRQCEPHSTHRLPGNRAAGAGDAANRETHIRARPLDRAFGHRTY